MAEYDAEGRHSHTKGLIVEVAPDPQSSRIGQAQLTGFQNGRYGALIKY